MSNVVAVAAVCPMRKEASHASEMVSQLLLGEVGEVLQETTDFIKLTCLYDGYEGWCAKSQLANVADMAAFNITTFVARRNAAGLVNGANVPLSIASPVFAKTSTDGYTLAFEEGIITNATLRDEPGDVFIKQLAYEYINTPYLWGGKSSFGIDCSGFTQQVFKMLDVHLLRDAYQQATQGVALDNLSDAACGDLAFFANDAGRITHVGILLDSSTIIHASGYVRIDKIDDEGIVHSVTGKRTHKLREVRRVEAQAKPQA